MKTSLAFFLALSFIVFAGEKYGVYDLQGNRISEFEAESHELPEKARQIKGDNPHKKLYVSSFKKGKGSKPDSRYNFKTGAYIEASRNETFSLCPAKKTEGTWISEHSVALDEKNCLAVQAPDLAGTFRILFMENSGLTDTTQVLVEQSYIQMGDYSHQIWVTDTAKINADERIAELSHEPPTIYMSTPGKYESRSYSQPLIVDKTKFTMGDAQYYFKIGDIDPIAYSPPYAYDVAKYKNWERQEPYNGEKLEGSRLPLVNHNGFAWLLANERSKKEGLDTAYYRDASGGVALDTSASGYRLPFEDEWFFLMRAGASSSFFWGDKANFDLISRYAWYALDPREELDIDSPVIHVKLKPVAQLLPNGFGLYDMVGIAAEFCNRGPEGFFMCEYMLGYRTIKYESFRLLRKTPKLHKLEKF